MKAEKLILTVAVALAAYAMFAIGNAFAADATVRWTHPTTRENDVPLALAEIRETQVDYGLCAGSAFPATPAGTQVVPAPATSVVITNLGYGTWCFRGRTADTGGLVSANSTVAQKVILAPPRPPVLSSTITVAYDVTGRPGNYRLGRVVGLMSIGTPCENVSVETNKGVYYEIGLDKLTLVRLPRSALVVTQCEWTS